MGKRKTTEEFSEEVKALVGDEYTVTGTYKNTKTPIEMYHKTCSQKIDIRPDIFLRGFRCRICRSVRQSHQQRKTQETFQDEVYQLVGNEYKVIGKYQGKKYKIVMKHNLCKKNFEVSPTNFLSRNSRCPHCNKKRLQQMAKEKRKTLRQFKLEVKKLVGSEYQVIQNHYISTACKIKMKHVICGYKWGVTPNNFLRGSRCPKCSYSKGEKRVEEILEKYNVTYKSQYKFLDCRNIYPLSFDFAVFEEKNKLIFLLEFDGEQHFRASFGEKSYQQTKRNDRIKNRYCKNKKIELVRIPYWEYENIEEIIKGKLFKNQLTSKKNEVV